MALTMAWRRPLPRDAPPTCCGADHAMAGPVSWTTQISGPAAGCGAPGEAAGSGAASGTLPAPRARWLRARPRAVWVRARVAAESACRGAAATRAI
jgi:hypothetical protein